MPTRVVFFLGDDDYVDGTVGSWNNVFVFASAGVWPRRPKPEGAP